MKSVYSQTISYEKAFPYIVGFLTEEAGRGKVYHEDAEWKFQSSISFQRERRVRLVTETADWFCLNSKKYTNVASDF